MPDFTWPITTLVPINQLNYEQVEGVLNYGFYPR